MTTPSWSVDQLGALADEWIAEREDFLSAISYYLSRQLPQVSPEQQQSLQPHAYEAELAAIGTRLHDFLCTIDGTVWYTLQHRMADYLRQLYEAFGATVRTDAQWLATFRPPEATADTHQTMRQAIGLMQYILSLSSDSLGGFDFDSIRFVRRLVSRIKYLLYPVRRSLPAFQRYWLLDDADPDTCEPTPAEVDSAAGIQRYEIDQQRGAYTAYIPEYYRADRDWPLILALHGGSGNDEDFLWTWLKYAKSRGYLLVSAKSFGSTWYPWDAPSVLLILDEIQTRYNVDASRILLTGLSDGGSFGYDVGFAFPERFAGLAVIAGILRPHQRHERSAQLPVYIAHGAQDQLFPVAYIRMVVENLRAWGHHVTYHELINFGHAYPSGENTAILDWFETTASASEPV